VLFHFTILCINSVVAVNSVSTFPTGMFVYGNNLSNFQFRF
jgi:hypothetical protein